ncbi:hypothetical protein [Metabacillus litoralis]|uniref:Uncharacterized protein n=1 Tax=Metabacillus litoralis TaxID=152268 RepID=A0A179SV01_9BACI|nr:hypothetical protein [Metabacillus litoralis]OAS85108.1 hypothetical protein A6K24_06245 [Metabacillus litoralis]
MKAKFEFSYQKVIDLDLKGNPVNETFEVLITGTIFEEDERKHVSYGLLSDQAGFEHTKSNIETFKIDDPLVILPILAEQTKEQVEWVKLIFKNGYYIAFDQRIEVTEETKKQFIEKYYDIF